MCTRKKNKKKIYILFKNINLTMNIFNSYHFCGRAVLALGYIAEGFFERYRAFVDAIGINIHAGVEWLLVYQDNQVLQRRAYRKGVYVDVRGAASAAIVVTLEYNWNDEGQRFFVI